MELRAIFRHHQTHLSALKTGSNTQIMKCLYECLPLQFKPINFCRMDSGYDILWLWFYDMENRLFPSYLQQLQLLVEHSHVCPTTTSLSLLKTTQLKWGFFSYQDVFLTPLIIPMAFLWAFPGWSIWDLLLKIGHCASSHKCQLCLKKPSMPFFLRTSGWKMVSKV